MHTSNQADLGSGGSIRLYAWCHLACISCLCHPARGISRDYHEGCPLPPRHAVLADFPAARQIT